MKHTLVSNLMIATLLRKGLKTLFNPLFRTTKICLQVKLVEIRNGKEIARIIKPKTSTAPIKIVKGRPIELATLSLSMDSGEKWPTICTKHLLKAIITNNLKATLNTDPNIVATLNVVNLNKLNTLR